jgi:hypothetical protein
MKDIIQKLLKINPFDLLIVIFIIVLVGVFLFFRMQKHEEWVSVTIVMSQEEWWWDGSEPKFWYVDNLKAGDKVFSSLGSKIAEIIDVQVFEVGGPYKKAMIDVRLKVTYDKNKQIYLYNQKPIEIGGFLNLSFNSNNVRGLVMSVGGNEAIIGQLHTKRIKVRVEAVPSWMVDTYREGLAMKNSQGEDLAVIEKIVVESALLERFSDIRGSMIKVRSQKYYDIVMDLSVKAFESYGNYYFLDGSGLKVGSSIWFFFPETFIGGELNQEILTGSTTIIDIIE